MWIALASIFGFTFLFLFLIYNGIIGYMPDIEELKNPKDKFASVVYSADGQELGRFFSGTGNRVYADYDDISQHMIDALIATEDSRFEDHSGIDVRALVRVAVKTLILQQKNAGGGSTLTQQLAKQLYSPQSDGIWERALQKPIEWMIAVKLERFYSKEEILKMYLNQFDFLYNAVGIKSAAYVYFGKEPKDLNIEEAATLVGMVKNPSFYNPVRKPERTRDRRNTVLEQMYKNDMISRQELDSLSQLPLTLDFHKVDHKEGLAPYFREELRRILRAKRPEKSNYRGWEQQKFIDDSIAWETNPLYGWIEKNPKADGTHYDIYTDGLKIYTTIDSRMQRYAEEAVVEHLGQTLQPSFFREKRGVIGAPYTTNREELPSAQLASLIDKAMKQTDRYYAMHRAGASAEEIKKAFNTPQEMKVFTYSGVVDTVMTPMDSMLYQKHFLRSGFMSMDPVTGHVKAYVGGPNFTFFQYDMVSTGRRQIGSTIKPFLYTYAMEEGYTPCDMFLNTQPTILDEIGRPWSPRNAGSARVGEMVDLRWALTNSNNWISARLMSQLSPATLVRNLHNFGITNKLDPVMSLCLGPCDVSVKEMVTAYSAFANKGMRVDPLFVTAIADASGNIISEFAPRHTEVISTDAYYKILSILLNVVDSGTGNRLRRPPYNITAQMGGKTGTTNSNSDGWFMGFTPQLVSGVWVGGEERYIHFNGMAMGQGASMALPVYGKYISKVYADSTLPYKQDVTFTFPEGIDLCQKEYYGEYDEPAVQEESIEGVFD
ncbi:MAG: transglycosylase domain-containing protein [Muribaculum sp.]|nr:transglycosylase domain-containing protein [Muribaculaceae bacterium]MCM1081265.1 transglycosylase domain-containing protein [Muribaculum sp.]